MGLFKKKKNTEAKIVAAEVAVSEVGEAATDSVKNTKCAEGCGNNPADDELAAVFSAAVSAYEADMQTPSQAELAVVIAAAVAAYEDGGVGFISGRKGPTGLSIRKLNRNAGQIPAWGVMGNREAIDARNF